MSRSQISSITHMLLAKKQVVLVLAISISMSSMAGDCFADESQKWLQERPFSYSIKNLEQRSAIGYYKFEWRKNNMDGTRRTKGTELKSPPMPGLKDQWAAFKVYIPKAGFADDKKFTIIMQYHSVPDLALGEVWRNPVADLLLRDGRLQYDFRASAEAVTPIKDKKFIYTSTGSISLGKPKFDDWNEIILHQKFDYYSGSISIWVNGVPYERAGVGLGFNDKSGPFFKFGLYCPAGSDVDVKSIAFKNVMLLNGQISDDESKILSSIRSKISK